jgi:NAD(P)-dependent dehydrogenase (short-subunit alcohol dehydrogenase family)
MGKLTLLSFIRSQCAKRPPVEKVDLTGKTVVVVGANVGLGFEATKHFASMNPGRLILACRSQSKGQAALESKCSDAYL